MYTRELMTNSIAALVNELDDTQCHFDTAGMGS